VKCRFLIAMAPPVEASVGLSFVGTKVIPRNATSKRKEHFPVMNRAVVTAVGIVVGLALAASAQENRSEISLQGGGLFTTSNSGNGIAYSTTKSGELLGTYRYHLLATRVSFPMGVPCLVGLR
jgi:hypothetical protein